MIRNVITLLFVVFLINKLHATSWGPAYPYTQKIDGQDIVLQATPYNPYMGPTTNGITKVYFKNKLLYTVNCYYRDNIYTSNDGEYIAIVTTNFSVHHRGYNQNGKLEPHNFNRVAIEILKHGKPFITYCLKDVADTTKLIDNIYSFSWGYYCNKELFKDAIWHCNYYKKTHSAIEINNCLITKDTNICSKETINHCDSVKIFERENFIRNNSVYISNNCLFVITNYNQIVKINFDDFLIEKFPFESIIKDKNRFNPPLLTRKYQKVKWPDKFDSPKIKGGQELGKAIAYQLNLKEEEIGGKRNYCLFVHALTIDKKGKCIEFDASIYDERISTSFNKDAINIEMTEKLNKWILEQTFLTKLIPSKIDTYSFRFIIDLSEK